MVEPFENLLARLEPTVTTIVSDTLLFWAVDVGNRRNIPVASFWSLSASSFSAILHFDLLVQNGHFPVNSSGIFVKRALFLGFKINSDWA